MGSAIHTGFGYRLLRRLAEDHAYRVAPGAFDDLRDAILITAALILTDRLAAKDTFASGMAERTLGQQTRTS